MLKMTSKVVLVFLVTTILVSLATHAAPAHPLLPIIDHQAVANAYVVHVHGPNRTDLHRLSSEELETWYLSFLPNTTLDSGEPRLLHSYRHVMSGFAAMLTTEELAAVEAMDGFVAAHPDGLNHLGTTYTPTFLELNSWDSLWQASDHGRGIIIGVLDSGIVPTHASFGDGNMPLPPTKWRGCCEFSSPTKCKGSIVPSICNNKLIGAMNFAFGTALDERGHGTHVAGTAAGNWVPDAEMLGQSRGTAAGMAPLAHLASYKVCSLGCRDSGILAGMDRAVRDGVDVLSLSLGSPKEHFYASGVTKGTFVAVEKGIFASACAGNDGYSPNALWNDAPWILTVGASSHDRVARAVVRLGDGREFDGESGYQPGPPDFNSPMMPVEFPGVVQTDKTLACKKGSLDNLGVAGKIVLCASGLGDTVEMGEVVKAAGGAAMIVLNNNFDGYTIRADPHIIPASYINHNDSLDVIAYYNKVPHPTATIVFKGTEFDARKAPAVASFSSRGPSLKNGGIIKPDIIGPGVDILAAWHKEVGPHPTGQTSPFYMARGCSMATPHLSGIAALLKGSHPTWSPAAIKSAIMTTAHIVDRDGDPITDEKSLTRAPATPFEMGSGHVNPPKANDPGLVYNTTTDEYIRYLCGLGYTDGQMFQVVNRRIHCSNIHRIQAQDLNYPSIAVQDLERKMHDVPRTLTNVADVGNGEEEYRAEVVEPEGTEVVVEPDRLKFSRVNQQERFEVKIRAKKHNPGRGKYSKGYLTWVSKKHSVRSPISVKF